MILKLKEETLKAPPLTARTYYLISEKLDTDGRIPEEAYGKILETVFGVDAEVLLEADPVEFELAILQVRQELNRILKTVAERYEKLAKNE